MNQEITLDNDAVQKGMMLTDTCHRLNVADAQRQDGLKRVNVISKVFRLFTSILLHWQQSDSVTWSLKVTPIWWVHDLWTYQISILTAEKFRRLIPTLGDHAGLLYCRIGVNDHCHRNRSWYVEKAALLRKEDGERRQCSSVVWWQEVSCLPW